MSMKLCKQNLGHLSVPGVFFVAGLSREVRTQREQYVLLITSRWGIAFEVAIFNKD
jgi:hypothetical protein